MATTVTPPAASAANVTPPADFTSTLDSAFDGSEAVTSAEEALAPGDGATETEPEAPGSPETGDEIVDPEGEEEEAAEQPDAEAEEPQEEAPPADEDSEVKPGEHKGKKGFFLTENRYRTFEGAHKNVQAIEAVLNEPLTPEVAQRNYGAYLGQEQMHADFLAADQASQQKFLQHFVSESKRALADGEASTDAMVSLAGQLPAMLERMHPDAHSVLMTAAARKLIDDLLPVAKAAIQPGDKNSAALLYSLQHIEKKLFGGSFTKEADIRMPDPNAQRQSRERSAVEELNELKARQSTETWNRWQTSTNENIRSTVNKEISDAIDGLFAKAPKALAALKKTNPDKYQAQVDLLNSKIKAEFQSNAELRRAVQVELRNAKIAASEQKRADRSESIVKRHQFAAKRVIEQHLSKIRSELNTAASGALATNHQKREAASQNRAPSGSSGEMRQSLVPPKNPATGKGWDPAAFNSHIDRLLG
jgi:hypothetical protein